MSTRTGPLDPVKLYKIFRSLLDQRLSGQLVLTRGQIVKRARFVDGAPVRVQSNARRESAVTSLQEQGFLGEAELAQIAECREQHRLTGDEALLRLGFVDLSRLQAVEARLARRRLLEVFTWRDGEYSFSEVPCRLEPGDEAIDLIGLLVEAAARVTPEESCRQFVDQYRSQAVRLSPWAEIQGPGFDAAVGTPNIRAALFQPASYEELVARLRDPDRVARQLFTLVMSGLAVFHRPGEGIPAPVAAPRPMAPPGAPPVVMRGGPVAARPSGSGPRPVVDAAEVPAGPAPSPAPRPAPSARPRPAAPAPSRVPPAATPAPGAGPLTAATAPRPPRPADAVRAPKPLDERARQTLAAIEVAHEAMRRQTHYEILGLHKDADMAAIRAEYRKLARDFHVDRFARFGLDPERTKKVQEVFMAINRAHETLTDVERRKEYDLQLDLAAKGQRVGPNAGGPDVGTIFRAEMLVRDGTILLRNGNGQPAKLKFEEALAATPADVVARAGLAFADFLIAQTAGNAAGVDAARVRLEEVVRENEARDEPFLYLGKVYRTRGDVTRAAAMFKRALDVNPRCAEAASELRHLQRKSETTPSDKSPGGMFGRKKA